MKILLVAVLAIVVGGTATAAVTTDAKEVDAKCQGQSGGPITGTGSSPKEEQQKPIAEAGDCLAVTKPKPTERPTLKLAGNLIEGVTQ